MLSSFPFTKVCKNCFVKHLLLGEVLGHLEHLLLGDVAVVVPVHGVEGPLRPGRLRPVHLRRRVVLVPGGGRGRPLAQELLLADEPADGRKRCK